MGRKPNRKYRIIQNEEKDNKNLNYKIGKAITGVEKNNWNKEGFEEMVEYHLKHDSVSRDWKLYGNPFLDKDGDFCQALIKDKD